MFERGLGGATKQDHVGALWGRFMAKKKAGGCKASARRLEDPIRTGT